MTLRRLLRLGPLAILTTPSESGLHGLLVIPSGALLPTLVLLSRGPGSWAAWLDICPSCKTCVLSSCPLARSTVASNSDCSWREGKMRVQCLCAGTSREVVTLCSDFSVPSIAGVRSRIGAGCGLWEGECCKFPYERERGERARREEPAGVRFTYHIDICTDKRRFFPQAVPRRSRSSC